MFLLWGPPGSGKTYIADSICDLIALKGKIGKFTLGQDNKFLFENLLGARLGYMSEGVLWPQYAEAFKSVLSDKTFNCGRKGDKAIEEPRVPIIGTTNNALWQQCFTQKIADAWLQDTTTRKLPQEQPAAYFQQNRTYAKHVVVHWSNIVGSHLKPYFLLTTLDQNVSARARQQEIQKTGLKFRPTMQVMHIKYHRGLGDL